MARVSAPDLRKFEEGDALRRLRAAIERPSITLTAVGKAMKAASQKAFRDQRWDKDPWSERMTPNIPGLIRDFEDGKKPPERRFQGTSGILQDTGALFKSINYKVHGEDFVEVGALTGEVPYAGVLNFGGPDEWELSARAVAGAKKWLASIRTSNKDRHDMLAWMGKDENVGIVQRFEHPPRPFIGIHPELVRDVERMLGVTIAKGAA